MGLLEKPIFTLINTERFYANFILGSRVVYDDPKIERACVGIKNKELYFKVNPDWFATLTDAQQIAVLKHEVLHAVLDHIGNRAGDILNHQLTNIAKDCAINQHISDLPSDCITLAWAEEMCKKKLLPKESWEYYYKEMAEVADKQEVASWMSDHDEMNESEKGDLDRVIIKDKVNQAIKASGGLVPNGLESIIGNLNKPATISWKQLLRNFVSSARDVQTKSTRLKTHRRFELDQPGKKKKRNLILGVCTDSSGSISDEAYSSFLNEISSIAKNTTITYLVHADSEVQKVDVIKGGKAKPGVLTKRFGSGGTAYQPAIDECVKRKCDAIIYFGDFDCADTPTNPGIPFIWVGVGSQNPPGDFGKVIRL
jgi:predicted metal-dependent peptidase